MPRLAPIMSDRLQAMGTWNGTGAGLVWTDTDGNMTVASANHVNLGGNNVPPGGNFLFEDAHVGWYRFDARNAANTVDVGCAEGGWVCFYKVPNVVTN